MEAALDQWVIWVLSIDALSIAAAALHLIERHRAHQDKKISPREWSRDDLLACVLSGLAYFNVLAGTALLFLNQWVGWVMTGITALQVCLMYVTIDPKLKMVSGAFEKKQQEYLDELDKMIEWE